MAKDDSTEMSGRKRQWFARRQVYLRAGQDSQFVELSPILQIGTAVGFGVLALWLIASSYTAIVSAFGEDTEASLLARLEGVEQTLNTAQQERDAALEEASKIGDLKAALAKAEAQPLAETNALATELAETKAAFQELQTHLSEARADKATLEAEFEAQTAVNVSEADEAAGLHAQLEKAFVEIEALQQERDAATAERDTLRETDLARNEESERNNALLKAATAEIERLQETLSSTNANANKSVEEYQATVGKLEEQLGEVVTSRADMEREIGDLNTALEEAQATALVSDETDAESHAQSIEAGLEEADLLATIDGLQAKLTAFADSPVEDQESDESETLKQRVAIAEAEIERLILAGLKEDDDASGSSEEDPGETERLRSELLAAQADIIKLDANVKAAKRRLAEREEADGGEMVKPDNSVKLERQLASTRSRVQQLNKALADAKLREVAIDLALINVVPTPSPPAPR